MRVVRQLALLAGICAGMMIATGTAGAAASTQFGNFTCHQGKVKAGTYSSLTVTGVCTLTNSGTVSVRGDLTVADHGAFNAITLGTLHVGGDVNVGDDAVAGIGCSPAVGCPSTTSDTIAGDLEADGAWATIVHSTTIGGDVSVEGGGGSENCASTGLFGGPYFTDFEDNSIGGNVSLDEIHSCWLGFIRDHVTGNVSIVGNRFGDPDAMEIVTNVIGGNLGCFDNVPQAHVGDSHGLPNVVGGHKRGECAAPGL